MAHRQVFLGIFVAIFILGSGLVVAGSGPDGPWVSADGTAPALRLAEVSYEVDVFGTLAVGTLVQSFVNESGEVLYIFYRDPGLRGLKSRSVELEVDGKAVESADQQPEPVPAAARRTKTRKTNPSGPQMQVGPYETVSVHVGFEASLGIAEGTFRLRLPAPSYSFPTDAVEPSADEDGQAETAETPVAVSATVKVVLHHPDPPLSIDSPSHEIFTDYAPERTVVELASTPGLEGRDFEVDFRFGDTEEPALHGFVRPVDDDVHEITAVLTPPSDPTDDTVRAKQMILILDTSGSMGQKSKLERGREALFSTLEQLRDTDTFNIFEFDEKYSSMSERPVAMSMATLDGAKIWLNEQEAGGGTRLLPALQSAFIQPDDPERHRMVVVLTDGQVADKAQVEELLQDQQDRFRVFFMGVGEDVDEATLRRFSEICRGVAAITRESDDLGATAADLFDSVSEPLAWDLELDWGGAVVERVSPQVLPDLYAGRAVTVIARIRGELPPTLTLHGATVEGERTFSVVLPDPTEEAYLQGEAEQP